MLRYANVQGAMSRALLPACHFHLLRPAYLRIPWWFDCPSACHGRWWAPWGHRSIAELAVFFRQTAPFPASNHCPHTCDTHICPGPEVTAALTFMAVLWAFNAVGCFFNQKFVQQLLELENNIVSLLHLSRFFVVYHNNVISYYIRTVMKYIPYK